MRRSRWYSVVSAVAAFCAAVAPPAVAGPALLFDANDGSVYFAEEQDQAWYPASLTKLLTAYITFEAIKAGKITLETKVTVSEKAHAQPPSKVGLPVGGEMTVEMALKALIIKSANDVAVMELATSCDLGCSRRFGSLAGSSWSRTGRRLWCSGFTQPGASTWQQRPNPHCGDPTRSRWSIGLSAKRTTSGLRWRAWRWPTPTSSACSHVATRIRSSCASHWPERLMNRERKNQAMVSYIEDRWFTAIFSDAPAFFRFRHFRLI